jgi:DedD protein
MGLFSSSNKNKQDRAAEDSGRFYSKDDDAAIGERARAKRASNAGAEPGRGARKSAADPLLPEKKRARRRLVGAIALALAAAVGLPMLLDSEPKPLAGDIAVQIPAKDKAAPLPVPGDKAVAAEDSVDKGEEVVSAAAVPAAPKTAAPAVAKVELPKSDTTTDAKPDGKPNVKAEAKVDPKAEARAEARAEHKAEEARQAERKQEQARAEHERKEKEKAEARLAERERADKERADKAARLKVEEKARALAILEGKQAEKAKSREADAAKAPEKEHDHEKAVDAGSQRFVLQIAAMSSQEKAAEVQARLREAGISSYTQKTTTPSGELIRVRVGPLSREDAEKVRAKLGKLGMSGAMTPV